MESSSFTTTEEPKRMKIKKIMLSDMVTLVYYQEPRPMAPFHPNISIHIPQTVLFTFLMVLTKRICLTIRSFFTRLSFPLFSQPLHLLLGR